jgi:translocation and assembly module TamB
MKRNHGRTLLLLALGLLAALIQTLRTEWAGEQLCSVARQRLPGLLDMEVGLGRCSIDPLRGGVEVVGLSLTPHGAHEPLLAADRALVRLRTVDFLSGRVRIGRLEIDRPRLRLDLTQPKPKAPDKKPTCALEQLDRVEIESLSLSGARVELLAPDGRTAVLEELDADAQLVDRTYSARVSVARGEVHSGSVAIPVSRLRLAASLDLDEGTLTIGHAEVAAGDFSFFARGDVESICQPRPSLEVSLYAPLDLASAALGERVPKMTGSAAVVLRLEGSLEDPAVEAEVTLSRAKIEDFEIGDAYLVARIERDRAVIDRLDLHIGDGKATAHGTIGLTKGFPVKATVDLDGAELARILDKLTVHHAWVNFRAAGRVEVEGQIAPFHLAGPASIDVSDFRVYDNGFDRPNPGTILQFDRAHVDLHVDFNPERAHLAHGRIRTRRSDLDADAKLYFDQQKGLDIEASMHELDLADLGHIVGIPWDGKMSGNARLKGPYGSDIAIDGSVRGREFKLHKLALGSVDAQVRFRKLVLGFPSIHVQKGRSRFSVDGELDFRNPDFQGRGHGTFEDAQLSDLVAMIGDEHWIFDLLRGRMEARISGTASVDGSLMAPHSLIDVKLSDATYFERKLGAGVLNFRTQDGRYIAIDRLQFDGPCGKLSFNGQVDLDQGLDFTIDAPLLHVPELAKPDAVWLEAGGELGVKAHLFGPPEHVQMDGKVEARDMAVFGIGLGSGTLALGVDRTNLWLKGPLGDDVLLDGRMIIEGPLPFAAGVSIDTEDLGHYLPKLEGLTGSLEGELLAAGTIERYQETRGDVRISRLEATKDGQSYQSTAPISIGFEGKAVELKSLALRGSSSLKLNASGIREASGDLDFSVDGSFDARLIESFTPYVEQAGGRVHLTANIAGPSDSPTIVGSAELHGGRFVVPGWPVNVRDLEGRLEFSQSKLYLQDLEGSLNNGRALVRGEIGLQDFKPQRLDLGLLMDTVNFRYPESLPTTFSGELRLYGPLTNLVLAGDLDLLRLRYSQDIDLESWLRDLRKKRAESSGFEKKEEMLRYDLLIHVPGDARIDNNLVKVGLKGDLKVVGNNLAMGVLGTLTAEEGGRAFFRDNEISLTRASIDFTEHDRIAAAIDVHGETTVRDYKVYIHAYGPAEDPEVELTSEPELAHTDLVTLLTLGVTSKDSGMNTAGTGAGLVGETLFNIAGLDKQVKRFIPSNRIIRDFSFHISTQYSDVSGMVEPTVEIESKFLTDALKLRLSQPVISGRGRRAQAEYRFSDHMSAQTQWDNESSESPVGDLGLDLKLRWELE